MNASKIKFSAKGLLRRFWPTALFLIALIILYFFHTQFDLSYQRELVEDGQWWRIVSGQLVHNNFAHLLPNMAALVLCRLLLIAGCSEREFIFHLFFCTVLTGVLIHILLRSYDYYLGISAVVYGMLFVGAVTLIRARHYWAWAVLLILALKLMRDYFAPETLAGVAARIGVPVAVEAHFVGVLAGVLIMLCRYAMVRALRESRS
ncbi:rhombosortase [Zhongshania marina]|uniref:Rhombosortase n=1 Tax=Zhongshania marina TaxID=2304603 RepID=A0A2S4HIR1_9GAMM|nr:rhombosortase [Marortus luteolus]POP53877.1 rhombosortase [Marortus luteolus]